MASLSSARMRHPGEAGLLAPTPGDVLARTGSHLSGTGSEADSLLDLYGARSANRSGANSLHHAGSAVAVNGDIYQDDDDPESSRWIHRDKLARIEIEEMQRAGITIGSIKTPAGRRVTNGSEPHAEPPRGVELPPAGEHQREAIAAEPDPHRPPETKRTPAMPAPNGPTRDEPMDYELRRPEEVAASAGSAYPRRLVRKSSYSKIPISKTSPIPVPQDVVERHTPARRHGSGTWTGLEEDGIAYKKPRSRSHSVGSQMLLDDYDDAAAAAAAVAVTAVSTPTSSATKAVSQPPSSRGKNSARSTGAGPGSRPPASRDGPTPTKARTRSAHLRDGSIQRPATRSGEMSGGSGVKRPEGDPPWLATMFKPDPRLPPDQQLIPTVAKRLQQEQWEREGKAGSVFDRDLNPISIYPDDLPPALKPAAAGGSPQKAEEAEWPLQSVKDPTSTGHVEMNGGASAGYQPVPLLDPPTKPLRTTTTTPTPTPPLAPPRPEPAATDARRSTEAPGEKKGLCGCCIVM
ncbi:MAG: hypothetical protein M1826_006240 [Phylliscum demangeonii]|nr:MAG: hypothetical protein M1826_006240 [Phylliscum demangeonii]